MDINCWGNLARHVLVSVDKGHPLVVLGKLETRAWFSKESGNEGEKRTALSVYATHIGIDLNEREVQVIKAERTTERRDAAEETNEQPQEMDRRGENLLAMAGSAGASGLAEKEPF